MFGSIRSVRASVEAQRRDLPGIIALACGAVAVTIAVAVFLHSPRALLPF